MDAAGVRSTQRLKPLAPAHQRTRDLADVLNNNCEAHVVVDSKMQLDVVLTLNCLLPNLLILLETLGVLVTGSLASNGRGERSKENNEKPGRQLGIN